VRYRALLSERATYLSASSAHGCASSAMLLPRVRNSAGGDAACRYLLHREEGIDLGLSPAASMQMLVEEAAYPG